MIESEPEEEEDELPDIHLTAPEAYPWTDDPNEKRRAFIIELMANPDYDGGILVGNMELIYQWLTTGAVPKGKK